MNLWIGNAVVVSTFYSTKIVNWCYKNVEIHLKVALPSAHSNIKRSSCVKHILFLIPCFDSWCYGLIVDAKSSQFLGQAYLRDGIEHYEVEKCISLLRCGSKYNVN